MKYAYLCVCFLCLLMIPFIFLFTNASTKDYYILNHGNKGLVILIQGSKETVISDTYYQSIGPYMDDYMVVTYTLPYHNKELPLEWWSRKDMREIVRENNYMIDIILEDYPIRPLILSGISRGGYLSAMYPTADYYFLFSPVIDWNQLREWKGKNKTQPMPSFRNDSIYYVYTSRNDDRVNGTYVIDYVEKQCVLRICDIVIGDTGHSVPVKIFKEAVDLVF